jgi:hypothetical protein
LKIKSLHFWIDSKDQAGINFPDSWPLGGRGYATP